MKSLSTLILSFHYNAHGTFITVYKEHNLNIYHSYIFYRNNHIAKQLTVVVNVNGRRLYKKQGVLINFET